MGEYREWPHDLDGLVDMARNEILPEFYEMNDDPTRKYPTVKQLGQLGYRNLNWVLHNKHDMSVKEFFTMIVGVTDDVAEHDGTRDWDYTDPETIANCAKYLDWMQQYREWNDATVDTTYYYLNRILREYNAVVDADSENLITAAQNDDHRTELYDAMVKTIHTIRQDAETDNSAYQYLLAIRGFFDWLSRRHVIDENPIKPIAEEFNFDLDTEGTESLKPVQLGQLWEEATKLHEYLVIIGYIGWGVRRQELPAVRRSQFEFDDNVMRIEFEAHQRKNDAGTVTVVVGRGIIEEQFERLDSHSDWNGHLLPDPDDIAQPMKKRDAADIFRDVCKRADVTLDDGSLPSPNNGRALWHDMNARAEGVLMEMEYTEDQAYEDDESPLDYQSSPRKENIRQLLFKKRVQAVLPDEAVTDNRIIAPDLEQQYSFDPSNFADD